MHRYLIVSFFLFRSLACILAQEAKNDIPVAWWKFDSVNNSKTIDEVSLIQDSISGYFSLKNGVYEKSLQLDGYTTKVVHKRDSMLQLTDALSLEAWVALNSYPWNWTAIIDQGGNELPHIEEELPAENLNELSPGLIGVQFGNPKLQRAQTKIELLASMNNWTGGMNNWTGGMNNWSARWRGYIRAPVTAEVIFTADSDAGLQIKINENYIINSWNSKGIRTGVISMIKGEWYPVILMYSHDGGSSFLNLSWSWPGEITHAIPVDALGYCERDALMARREIIPPLVKESSFESRIFFGIDPHGHLGFRINVNGNLFECISEESLPLLKWCHVAAIYSQERGMEVFINGKEVGNLKVKGIITPEKASDLFLGKSHSNLGPVGSERKESAGILSPMVIDGLLDEVKIYDIALPPDKINKSYKSGKPQQIQPLGWRKLPAGPEKLIKKFDAVYTRLNYREDWESKWRVTEYPDILIHFDLLPVRYIFWRGTGYGGSWVTENDIWMSDQSLERANRGKSKWGCSEHMSDKQARYSSVRIVEKNDARIVIQWRYAISDIKYSIFGTHNGAGWGEWADEYYYIYPDGIATRYQILFTNYLSHEWQETIVLNQAGTKPEDNVKLKAMSLANMKGKYKTYTWKDGPPKAFSEPENIIVQLVNLKSRYKPFIIFEPGPGTKPFTGSVRPEYSHFPWWNHWPVSQLPNDGRMAMAPDRPSHSSLSQSVEASQVIHINDDKSYSVVTLTGMTDKPISDIIPLARSWNNPPEITLTSDDFDKKGYDKIQRAFVFSKKDTKAASELNFAIEANKDAPVKNLALVINDWGEFDAEVRINGLKMKKSKLLRIGYIERMEGRDLIIWFMLETNKPLNIAIKPIIK